MARRDDPEETSRKPQAGTNRPRRPMDVEEGAPEKVRVPAEPQPQRPGAPPIGNGGTEEPAAFPPHN